MSKDSDNKNNFIKTGFTKLLKPFEDSMNEVEKISKAFGLALRIYSSMTRKYQYDKIEPQINHSLRVALILNEEMNSDSSDLVCSALLHDIFNKQEVPKETKDYIKKEISEKTFTTVSFFSKYSDSESNKNEELKIEKLFGKIKQSDSMIKNIILAERLDELRSLKNSRRKDKIARIKEETQKYFVPLAETTNEKILLKLVIALYELK
ncbi:Bifunctional (p)ppGpp synthase/hydrolase RelA [Candidatus Nitrosocosmicus oleophilus]|jgi:(p)ppGpp synthase/HD superfamily hydrolase|uniref:Bifunctional (P)ppGpp synthase/hydrolase RelA n=1 Tax=Candidatus Nitrosocosmicus oleophilus TaxID=1353260 RepID=A0A654LXS2_9ARCH|nr:HD domain-containing protein [Candidatus Nitrosocosmicus oleophilus]ALI35079.1 Bifunctional (p)ppGpp synthase/hydrolase RelA [Candidatus Nitrosocosmicus oleophilus]